jgi:hypothetical protein
LKWPAFFIEVPMEAALRPKQALDGRGNDRPAAAAVRWQQRRRQRRSAFAVFHR